MLIFETLNGIPQCHYFKILHMQFYVLVIFLKVWTSVLFTKRIVYRKKNVIMKKLNTWLGYSILGIFCAA